MEKIKTKKRFSALNILWMIPLAAALAFLILMYVVPACGKVDQTPVSGSADWMAELPDDMLLSEVVLPGTHDSATEYVQLAFFSKCQQLGIGEQLEAGYRYLDIRLGPDNGRLKLMHGFTSCLTGGFPWSGALYADEVISECCAFLRAHPTETVLFAVKYEHGDESVAEFQRLLDSAIDAERDMWLLTDSLPTVGEARGKLVLLRRYGDEAGLLADSGVPSIWKQQSGHGDTSADTSEEDNGSYTLWVQDRYEYGTDDKWAAFLFGMAKAETGEGAAALNFLSTKGTFAYGHPYKFAKILDERLAGISSGSLRGWIIVDYASPKLAEHIYSANFEG